MLIIDCSNCKANATSFSVTVPHKYACINIYYYGVEYIANYVGLSGSRFTGNAPTSDFFPPNMLEEPVR